MPKLVVVCLCAVSLVALMAASLGPARVLAASATLTVATPLQDAPTPDGIVITLVPEGSVVSIDGPPVDGYYPVTMGDLSGWMPGETLVFEKDEIVAEDPNENPVSAVSGEVVPEDQPPLDTLADAAPGAEVATEETATSDASETSAPAAAETSEPIDTTTFSPDPSAPAAATTDGSPPLATGDAELVPETGSATPVALDPVGEAPVPDAGSVELTPIADPSVTAFPDAGPSGAASVTAETPILLGPGAEYGVIATAPRGSAVEQTGHQIGGYVTVKFGGITGWAAVDHLGPPTAATAAPAAISGEPATKQQPRHDRRRNAHRRH